MDRHEYNGQYYINTIEPIEQRENAIKYSTIWFNNLPLIHQQNINQEFQQQWNNLPQKYKESNGNYTKIIEYKKFIYYKSPLGGVYKKSIWK